MSAHKNIVLLDDATDESETVVLGEDLKKVLNGLVLASNLQDLRDDGLLVLSLKGGGSEDIGELGVLLEGSLKGLKGLVGRLEGIGLSGGGVLLLCWTSSELPSGSLMEGSDHTRAEA